MSSPIDTMEARAQEREDRQSKREHFTWRLLAVLGAAVAITVVLTLALTTHITGIHKSNLDRDKTVACLQAGNPPLQCRIAVEGTGRP